MIYLFWKEKERKENHHHHLYLQGKSCLFTKGNSRIMSLQPRMLFQNYRCKMLVYIIISAWPKWCMSYHCRSNYQSKFRHFCTPARACQTEDKQCWHLCLFLLVSDNTIQSHMAQLNFIFCLRWGFLCRIFPSHSLVPLDEHSSSICSYFLL